MFASRHVNWSVSVTPAPNQPSKPLTVAGEAVAPSIGWIFLTSRRVFWGQGKLNLQSLVNQTISFFKICFERRWNRFDASTRGR